MISKDFILAGDATFTIEPPVEFTRSVAGARPHYTYRVRHRPARGAYREVWFISFMTGPDNESSRSFTYLGILKPEDGQVNLTKNSGFLETSLPVRVARRVLQRIFAGQGGVVEDSGWAVHHEGRCGRCGHKLTTPESIERGIGPDCWEMMGGLRESGFSHLRITHSRVDNEMSTAEHRPLGHDRREEKAEFARREAEQERRAFLSDPDYVRATAEVR